MPLAEVNRLATDGRYPEQYIGFLRYLYGSRLEQLAPAEQLSGPPEFFERIADLRIAALQAERKERLPLANQSNWRRGSASPRAELDLEQTRLKKSVRRD
jgi:hypothetical protein